MRFSRIIGFSKTSINNFNSRHIGINKKDLIPMLNVVNSNSVDELIDQVMPQAIRFDLQPKQPISEDIALQNLKKIMKNNNKYISLIGLGYNNNLLPFPI